MRRDTAHFERVTHAVPGFGWSRRLEPIRSEGWRRVLNPFERRHAVPDLASQPAVPGGHDDSAGRGAHDGSSLSHGPPLA